MYIAFALFISFASVPLFVVIAGPIIARFSPEIPQSEIDRIEAMFEVISRG